MNYSEEEILALLSKSETKAQGFNLLVYIHQEKLYWVVRRILIVHEDVDDVLQEVWLKVWDGLSSFKGNSKLYTWIYRISVNEAVGFLRKKRRVFLLPIHNVEQELISYIENEGVFSGSEIEKVFQKALLTLPERQRLVFTIRYYDDLPFAEVAQLLSMSEGGVKSTYHLAVKKIKENLATH